MKLTVEVKPKAKRDLVYLKDNRCIIETTAIPEKGEANRKVVDLLAEFFRISKSNISIIMGHKAKVKVIDLEGL